VAVISAGIPVGETLGMAAGLALALGAGAVLGPSVQHELGRCRRRVQGGWRRHMVGYLPTPQLAGIRYVGRRSARARS
jgi:hypothetical protein